MSALAECPNCEGYGIVSHGGEVCLACSVVVPRMLLRKAVTLLADLDVFPDQRTRVEDLQRQIVEELKP